VKILVSACLIATLAGCGTNSGRLGDFPAIADKATASTVVIARINSFYVAESGFMIALDGKDFFGVGSGEHAEFLVPAGEHLITAKCGGSRAPSWRQDSLRFDARASGRYYFLVSPSLHCAEIKASDEGEARKHLETGKRLDLGKTVAP